MKSLKIQTQLLLIYSAVLLLGVSIIAWSIYTLNRLDGIMREVLVLDQEVSASIDAANALDQLASTDIDYYQTQELEHLYTHNRLLRDAQEYVRTALIRIEDPSIRAALVRVDERLQAYDQAWLRLLAQDDIYSDEGANLADQATEQVDAAITETYNYLFFYFSEEVIAKLETAYLLADASFYAAIVAIVIFAILAIVAASAITRSITLPILCLRDAARSYKKSGTFDRDTIQDLAKRKDEIGRLADAFLQMADEVGSRHYALVLEASDLHAKLDARREAAEQAPDSLPELA